MRASSEHTKESAQPNHKDVYSELVTPVSKITGYERKNCQI